MVRRETPRGARGDQLMLSMVLDDVGKGGVRGDALA